MRGVRRLLALGAAFVALAVLLSGCVLLKPESLQLSQPAGIGPVRLQVGLCTYSTALEEDDVNACKPVTGEGQAQLMLGLAVPKGSAVPSTLTAAPGPGAAPIRYTRNEEVAAEMAQVTVPPEGEGEPTSWVPPGSEVVGYLSEVILEKPGDDLEWTVTADLGLPSASDGGTFGGVFRAAVIAGWRAVDSEHPADRPIECEEGELFEISAVCEDPQEDMIGVADLRIGAPAPVRALQGGKASVPFELDYAGSVRPARTFALGATTTLPGASAAPASPSFTPGGLGSLNRARATAEVTVPVPAKASPGTYDVVLTATAPGGGAVSQVAKLQVAKARLNLGKVTLNRKRGTATLRVKVFEAGTLTVSGKGIRKARRKAKGQQTLRVVIRAKGKAKKALAEKGRAKVRLKVGFKPANGAAVTKSRAVTLVKAP